MLNFGICHVESTNYFILPKQQDKNIEFYFCPLDKWSYKIINYLAKCGWILFHILNTFSHSLMKGSWEKWSKEIYLHEEKRWEKKKIKWHNGKRKTKLIEASSTWHTRQKQTCKPAASRTCRRMSILTHQRRDPRPARAPPLQGPLPRRPKNRV